MSKTDQVGSGKDRVFFRKTGDDILTLVLDLYARDFNHSFHELTANAWDADAEQVSIEFDESNNSCTFADDGHGMLPKDLDDFFRVGSSAKKIGKVNLNIGHLSDNLVWDQLFFLIFVVNIF